VLLTPRAQAAASNGTPPSKTASPRPNVLLIVLDTVRADALSCYGGPAGLTPRLDALAAEGTLYERAFAQASWTLPSHASLFTGLLPSAHRTTAEHQSLDDRFTTLAKLLAEHGYRTFGYSNNLYASGRHNLAQGFQEFRAVPFGRTWPRELLAEQVRARLQEADYGAEDTTRTLRRWIDEAVSSDHTFFLFANYMEAHASYGVTPRRREALPQGVSLGDVPRSWRDIDHYAAGTLSIPPRGFEHIRALYHSDVAYLDERIGELMAHLRNTGILDETLVIVTSDHGEHFGDHALFGHRFSLYNALLHVPLIIRYPPAFEPGSREPSVVSLVDLFPTVLDVTGIQWENGPPIAGRSLLKPSGTRYTVAELAAPLQALIPLVRLSFTFDAAPRLRRLKCIQSAEAKYIWASDGQHELYDLRSDPEEQNNLIAERPEQAAALKAELEDRIGHPLAAPSPTQAVNQPDPRP
jgi:arylsulfatase A-like enzyme